MKILVTGANGLLGQHLIKLLLQNENFIVIGTGKNHSRCNHTGKGHFEYYALDITDPIAVNLCIQTTLPDIIVHGAAITQVDQCEQDPISCWNTNVTATRFLIEAARLIQSKFIYISTDFVFDGVKGMYNETDTLAPVNYYGSSKVAAEKSVESSDLNYAIVRTCLVYGNILEGNRSNIVSWVKENLEKQMPIRVVTDQIRTPTYVKDLAQGILLIIQNNSTGVFHISGEEIMTPHDIALQVAHALLLDATLILKATGENFRQTALRPSKTGFDISKAKNWLHYQPVSFNDGIRDMLAIKD